MDNLAAILAVLVLVVGLGAIWALFMASETRRHRAERDELERRNMEAHQASERALQGVNRGNGAVN